MNDASAPVAARNEQFKIQDDANLHVQVGVPTRRFHLWVQGPAWLLGFTSVGLGFLMVLRGYDSSAGWFAVSTGVILSVIASYRSPFSIGETAISTATGRKTTKKATTPAPPPG
jgi:uncharacterized membrane protein